MPNVHGQRTETPPHQRPKPLHKRLLPFALGTAAVGLFLALGSNAFFGEILFLLGMATTVVLGVIEIVDVLFRKLQIRLAELLVLVAVLGNSIGWTARWDWLEMEWGNARAAVVAIASFAWCVLVIGGAAWGLQLAAALGRRRTSQRLWLMLVGVACWPVGVYLPVSFFWGLVELLGQERYGRAAAILGSCLFSLLFCGYVVKLHRGLRLDEARGGLGGPPAAAKADAATAEGKGATPSGGNRD